MVIENQYTHVYLFSITMSGLHETKQLAKPLTDPVKPTRTYYTHATDTLFIIQGGPKKRTVFRLDNFVTVSPRKVCSMSKFSQILSRKKVQNSHFSKFKYSLPNLLKSSQLLKLWYI